jgi:hypothetical protein
MERGREIGVLFNDALNCEVYTASITYEYDVGIQETLSCSFIYHKSHMDCPGIETPPPRLEAATEPCHGRLL